MKPDKTSNTPAAKTEEPSTWIHDPGTNSRKSNLPPTREYGTTKIRKLGRIIVTKMFFEYGMT